MSENGSLPADSLEVNLIDSIAKNELENLTVDLAEVALDMVIDDEFLKLIPVVGPIVKCLRAAHSIKDRFFIKKVAMFLQELGQINQAKRQRFVEQLAIDEGSRSKAGESLVFLLDRLDNLYKSRIIGRIYLARLENKIGAIELRRFCMIVDRAFLPDLDVLSQHYTVHLQDEESASLLYALGLVKIAGQDYGTIDGIGAKTWYEISHLGRRFMSIAFPD
jgi:hypothetical protein